MLVAGGVTWAILQADKPPFPQIENTRKAIAATRGFKVEEWAPEYLKAAQDSLSAANRELDHQITRFFVVRDYDLVRARAAAAEKLARDSMPIAVARRDSVKKEALASLKEADNAIRKARQAIQYVELSGYSRSRLVALELARSEAMKAAGDGRYRLALQKTSQIINGATSLEEAVGNRLDDYSSPLWDAWARETIEWSRLNHAHAILVRKIDHRCDVYYAGQLKTSFAAELGIRWMGNKMRRGDAVTPEGRYRITLKKAGSKYYKALEINYPNDEDLRRFALARKSGKLPRTAGVGGNIQIHGAGGRGRDWTQGCVALRNSDIDRLFSMVDVGTPVTIVGRFGGSEQGSGTAR